MSKTNLILEGLDTNQLKNLQAQIEEKLKPKKITDKVKTFEDACDIVGVSPTQIINVDDSKDEIAYKKIKIIALALNEGWRPDWSNSNQNKYFPYFKAGSGPGSGFGYFFVGCHSGTYAGSRLCFKSSELAEYAGKQFTLIYNDFLTF